MLLIILSTNSDYFREELLMIGLYKRMECVFCELRTEVLCTDRMSDQSSERLNMYYTLQQFLYSILEIPWS
jgi:hypothetical protein